MIHTDAGLHEALSGAVAELEAHTSAEIVVVVAARSGSYTDVALGAGAAGVLLALGLALYSPWVFSPGWLLPDLLLVGGALAWLVAREPVLLRALTRSARRERQVDEAAAACFWQERVHATGARVGVLVYASALEAQVRVLPDLGAEQALPPSAPTRWEAQDAASLLAGLHTLGAALAQALPPGEHNPDELGNRPRVRA